MLPFKLVYSDDYYLPIGEHVFPAQKYRLVHERLLETGVADREDFLTPQPASDRDVLLVHTPQYVEKLTQGTLSAIEAMQMEIPYSRELVKLSGCRRAGRFWRLSMRSKTVWLSISAVDSIMLSPITAKVSA